MAVETNTLLDKKKNPEQSQIETRQLQDALSTWGEKKEITEETKQEAEKIVQKIISSNIPTAEMEAILGKLPIDKRFIVEKMILDEQKHQISTMSQERYKQYLQAQFPSGIPSNISEMVLSMVTDTSEMYKVTQKEIEKTNAGEKDPSEIVKKELQTNKREAVAATQKSEQETQKLSSQLSQVSKQEMV